VCERKRVRERVIATVLVTASGLNGYATVCVGVRVCECVRERKRVCVCVRETE